MTTLNGRLNLQGVAMTHLCYLLGKTLSEGDVIWVPSSSEGPQKWDLSRVSRAKNTGQGQIVSTREGLEYQPGEYVDARLMKKVWETPITFSIRRGSKTVPYMLSPQATIAYVRKCKKIVSLGYAQRGILRDVNSSGHAHCPLEGGCRYPDCFLQFGDTFPTIKAARAAFREVFAPFYVTEQGPVLSSSPGYFYLLDPGRAIEKAWNQQYLENLAEFLRQFYDGDLSSISHWEPMKVYDENGEPIGYNPDYDFQYDAEIRIAERLDNLEPLPSLEDLELKKEMEEWANSKNCDIKNLADEVESDIAEIRIADEREKSED